jgi:hypothetical protein
MDCDNPVEGSTMLERLANLSYWGRLRYERRWKGR